MNWGSDLSRAEVTSGLPEAALLHYGLGQFEVPFVKFFLRYLDEGVLATSADLDLGSERGRGCPSRMCVARESTSGIDRDATLDYLHWPSVESNAS